MNKTKQIINETQLTQEFVSPNLCLSLYDEYGLTSYTTHQWKIFPHLNKISTQSYDPDHYYAQSESLIDHTAGLQDIVPAYQIKDMEKLLPSGYCVSFTEMQEYELAFSNRYHELPMIREKRLPDLFARALMACFRARVLDVVACNKLFTSQKYSS